MGDHAAWGVRAREAFERAEFRLLLSGTPFRSDSSPIPWLSYDEDGVSRADYSYGGDWMGEVLRDADARLTEVRRQHPEAGGLVLASDQEHHGRSPRGFTRSPARRLSS